MNFEQLAGLIKAGFTEEQIRNIGSIMGTGTNTPTPTPTPTTTPTTTPAPTPTNTPTPTDAPADNPTPGGTLPSAALSPGGTLPSAALSPGGTLPSAALSTDPPKAESETVTLLKEMLGMMQRGNINTMGTGAMQEQTGADVLAEILNPTPKTK